MEIRVMQWNVLAHGLANDGFMLAKANEEPAALLDRARSIQILGQTMKKRSKDSGKKIKLTDLPAEVQTWDAPALDYAQRLKSNFEEILQEEQRHLGEIIDLPKRCAQIAAKVKEEQPDVIAFQELDMFEELNPLLEAAGYTAGSDNPTTCYRELAQRVKDLAIELKSDAGNVPLDFAQRYRELLREYASKGLCVCPNFASTARRFNPTGFDDGIAIFWKNSSFKPCGTPEILTYDMTNDGPAIRAKLQHSSGLAVDVMTLHLPSSPAKELRRQLNLWDLHEQLGGSPVRDGVPLILAVDLNSDAHLQPPLEQELEIPAKDGSSKKAEFELKEPLRHCCFQLLQGSAPVASERRYAHPADVEAAQKLAVGDFPFWGLTNAWGTQDRIPLSVVKMRGVASDQVKKWGELTIETTDHVFCSEHFHVLDCETGYPRHNHEDKQDFLKRFKDPKAPKQEELAELLKGLIPSATLPSDHLYIVAKLKLRSAGDAAEGATTFSLGDRVRILATKQQSKVQEATVKFVGATDFAEGEWLGVELDSKVGKNDGSVKGKSYFKCAEEYGLFLRPSAVEKIEPVPAARQGGSLQEILALAMEDHDVETLRRVLPEVERSGVDPKEIHFARQIIEEASEHLEKEVSGICSRLITLKNSVTQLEASAASAEKGAPKAVMYDELEKRLSERIPKVLDNVMAKGVAPHSGAPDGMPKARPAGAASSATTSKANVKQKFRNNLVTGLKDGSLETIVKTIPES